VASVLHEAAELDRSPQAGCAPLGTPEVEIELIQMCAEAAKDSMPPSVEAVGDGIAEAGNVEMP
jgi:hypothetical protein